MLTTVHEPRCTIVVSQPFACRSCATSCPLVPVPMTSAFLPRHSAPSVKSAVWMTAPLKSFSPGNSGLCGKPTRPLAKTRCFGCSVRSSAGLVIANDRVPAALRLIVRTADELRARPEVDLHGPCIRFEPVGEHVLRQIRGPRHRERHVGQVVHFGAVVQRERVIARAPAVADAREPVDDQRVHADAAERGRDRESGLASADDEHGGLAVVVALIRFALLLPVRAAEVA